jgi:NCAIR mutase (PurE)-related protein
LDDISPQIRTGFPRLAATDAKDDKDFQEIANFVRKGGVGYMLFVAEKPSAKKH